MPTDRQLKIWLQQWARGDRNKNEIERDELDDPRSHGKKITGLWRDQLGIETETMHPMMRHIITLEALLEEKGIDFVPYKS